MHSWQNALKNAAGPHDLGRSQHWRQSLLAQVCMHTHPKESCCLLLSGLERWQCFTLTAEKAREQRSVAVVKVLSSMLTGSFSEAAFSTGASRRSRQGLDIQDA